MPNDAQKTCQVEMYDGKPCGRPLYDGVKCICHSEKEDKDVKLFQQELDRIFSDEKTKYYDLAGFVFPKKGYTLPREYKKNTYFTEVTFSGDADFFDATFSGKTDFFGATFSGDADFGNAKFSGEADFIDATFSGVVSFAESTFSEDAFFNITKFSGEAYFPGARFSGNTYFLKAKFSEGADFSWVTFSRKTWFRATQFVNQADFSHCQADEAARVIFDGEGLQGEKNEMFPAGAQFIGCSFAGTKNVIFRKLSLEKCTFLETDISSVQFTEVTWPSKGKRSKRNVVCDEFVPDKTWLKWNSREDNAREDEPPKYQYSLIAQVYRRLQANYISNYRYAEAGDFHIGELEMMRKAKRNEISYVVSNIIYKYIAHYGESFIRPLLWLAFVLLLFPAVLLWDGINLNPSFQNTAVVETVNYEWSSSPGDFLPIKGDYWEAFVANFSLIAYSRSDIGKYLPESHTRFIVTIESLVVIALLAFFLLALRRQYKRKGF